MINTGSEPSSRRVRTLQEINVFTLYLRPDAEEEIVDVIASDALRGPQKSFVIGQVRLGLPRSLPNTTVL